MSPEQYIYPPGNSEQQKRLLHFIRTTPLTYGPWQPFKNLYKRVEADLRADGSHPFPELLTAFLARLDTAPLRDEDRRSADPTMKLRGIQDLLQFSIRDERAYVVHARGHGRNNNRVAICDIPSGDPLNPVKQAEFGVDEQTRRIAFCGPYLLSIADASYRQNGSLTIWDLSDPARPEKKGSIQRPLLGSVACSYPFVYALSRGTDQTSTVIDVISLADPEQPRLIAQITDIASIAGLDITGDGKTLIVATGGQSLAWNRLPKPPGLQMVDVSNPLRPRIVGDIPVRRLAGGEASGSFVYVMVNPNDRQPGIPALKVIDIRQPGRPTEVASVNLGRYGYLNQIMVRGNRVIVFDAYQGHHCVDVTDPHKPVYQSRIPFVSTQGMDLHNDLLYVVSHNGVQIWNLTGASEDRAPGRVGTPPSRETIGYMKRRGRRLLRTIGQRSPDRYVEYASALLTQLGDKELSPDDNWITFDILYGGSQRWEQAAHGRGRYTAKGGPKLLRRTREERLPAAWDAHPESGPSLLRSPAPPMVQEFAVRLLLARRLPVPEITEKNLARWIESESPVLVPLAAKRLAERFAEGANLAPRTVAYLLHRASPPQRQIVVAAITRRLDVDWQQTFATELLNRIQPALIPGGRPLRRSIAAARLMAEWFLDRIPSNQILPVAALLMRSRRDDLSALAEGLARRAQLNSLFTLNALLPLTDAQQEPILIGLEEAFRSQAFNETTLYSLLQLDSNEATHRLSWRVVAASHTPDDAIRAVWRELLGRHTLTPALRSAMASGYALTLLTRCGITTEQITGLLATRPFLSALLSPEAFARLVETIPVPAIFALAAAIDDPTWERLRGPWLARLEQGRDVLPFWLELASAMKTDTGGRIEARLLSDARFAETIIQIGGESLETLLQIQETALEGPLTRYLRRFLPGVARDTESLLTAATHPLAGVRALGLARVEQVRMSLPFALRLMESGIPASVASGKGYFEAIPETDRMALEAALALCDSPVKAVRRFGRDYVIARKAALPQSDLLTALFENPDPETQQFVATMVAETPVQAGLEQFERDVLRRRNAGRKAKEAVKARQEQAATIDVATLLELARGAGTPRDAEWALSQLAKRALAGEQIPGFSIEGIAGI